ncbi:MAG: MBL fold metallo-hydrolase [Candidatus Marinimicrobia bacterium]|nr:MBL fold metallo-hydrolase [Candidatus Neomarinimicrobiota bacterium]
MGVKTMITGPFQENSYLAWTAGSNRAVIIDPGDDADRLQAIIEAEHLQLAAILATHAHLDHVGAVDQLRKWSGAPVCIPEGERELLAWLPASCRLFGLPERPVPEVDHWLKSELTQLSGLLPSANLGDLAVTIHATPGHTAGGVCYQIDQALFVGDTLFHDSVGRTDLPGGDWPTLEQSLRYLMTLPDDLVVYPGHGPATTLGREKQSNPYLLDIQRGAVARA